MSIALHACLLVMTIERHLILLHVYLAFRAPHCVFICRLSLDNILGLIARRGLWILEVVLYWSIDVNTLGESPSYLQSKIASVIVYFRGAFVVEITAVESTSTSIASSVLRRGTLILNINVTIMACVLQYLRVTRTILNLHACQIQVDCCLAIPWHHLPRKRVISR